MPGTFSVDLHPVFRSDRDIDKTLRTAFFRAAAAKADVLEIIPGKGSGTLLRKVRAKLEQPHLKKLYRTLESDPANGGRILVRF